jgi:lipoprotein-releasing system ATP-binding protein
MSEVKIRGLAKRFETDGPPVEVLTGVDLDIARGDALAITGPSGAGKSTLLHLIGGLDQPSGGTIEIDGQTIHRLSELELARFRNRTVGFVFQDSHLLPQYTVVENVLVPTLAFSDSGAGGEGRAGELLDRVGLSHRLTHRPAQLSGGERQRVAVARALINGPSLLLCDEPTGSLDRAASTAVADLLFELHKEENNILVVVTHDLALAGRFPRRCELEAGRCSAL